MAQRESLKDMQARLAERLKRAQATAVSVSWLAVTAGGENYLLPLRQSGEILPITQWQSVPHTKPWFLGVMTLRGSLFGAVDLAQFIAHVTGLEEATQSRHFFQDESPSFVTINPMIEGFCALQVGRLTGLRAGDAFIASDPAPLGAPPFFGKQHFDAHGGRWQEINLQTLSQSDQFLNISA